MWEKVAEPSINFKSVQGADRGVIAGPEGRYSKYAYIVEPDYANRQFVIWFQNFINDSGQVDGDKAIRLPWLDADPWAFDAWNHEGFLKIVFKHWGDEHHAKGTYGVYNTGWFSKD